MFVWIVALTPLTLAAADAGPKAAILRGAALLRAAKAAAPPAAFAALLDTQEISRRVLGVHFGTLKPQQHAATASALRDYAEAVYRQQKPGLGTFEITCDDESVQGRFAKVGCRVTRGAEVTELTFLLKRGAQWRVFDIQAPDFALIRDNAKLADTVIRREEFDGYLRRLKNRARSRPAENSRKPARQGQGHEN